MRRALLRSATSKSNSIIATEYLNSGEVFVWTRRYQLLCTQNILRRDSAYDASETWRLASVDLPAITRQVQSLLHLLVRWPCPAAAPKGTAMPCWGLDPGSNLSQALKYKIWRYCCHRTVGSYSYSIAQCLENCRANICSAVRCAVLHRYTAMATRPVVITVLYRETGSACDEIPAVRNRGSVSPGDAAYNAFRFTLVRSSVVPNQIPVLIITPLFHEQQQQSVQQ